MNDRRDMHFADELAQLVRDYVEDTGMKEEHQEGLISFLQTFVATAVTVHQATGEENFKQLVVMAYNTAAITSGAERGICVCASIDHMRDAEPLRVNVSVTATQVAHWHSAYHGIIDRLNASMRSKDGLQKLAEFEHARTTETLNAPSGGSFFARTPVGQDDEYYQEENHGYQH